MSANLELPPEQEEPIVPGDSSWPITKEEMLIMRGDYFEHTGKILVAKNGVDVTLEGLRFDAHDILKIIMGNNAPAEDTLTIKELYVLFGAKPIDGSVKKYITTIAAGIDANNTVITGNMYEFCKPCPDNCPSYDA